MLNIRNRLGAAVPRALLPLVMVASAFLAGCATVGERAGVAPVLSNSVQIESLRPPFPSVELDEWLLFQLMSAEMAMYRQNYSFAAEQYLNTAVSTRDARLAEKAARIGLLARYDGIARSATLLWVELEPKSIKARESLVSALIRSGDVDLVQPHLEYLISRMDVQDDEERNMRLMMVLTGQQQNFQTAIDALDRYLVGHVDDYTAWYVYGYLNMRTNQLVEAEQGLAEARHLRPRGLDVLQLHVQVLKKQGRFPEAAASLRQAIKNTPKVAELHIIYARVLLEMLRINDAKREFLLAFKYAPKDVEALFSLALLSLQEQRADDAIEYLQGLRDLDWEPSRLNYYFAQAEEMRGNNQVAIEYYLHVEEGTQYFEAQARSAVLLARRGEMAQARQRLHYLGLQFFEKRLDVIRLEGELLYNNRQYEESVALYTQALSEFPGNYNLLFDRALSFERVGRVVDAERDLKAILEDNPQDISALNALGFTLADRTDRFQEAYDYIKRALDLSPEDPAIIDSMGWVLYRLGDLSGAESHLRRALAMKKDEEIAAHLGEVLWMMGRQDEARQTLKAALKVTPDADALLSVMRRIGLLQ